MICMPGLSHQRVKLLAYYQTKVILVRDASVVLTYAGVMRGTSVPRKVFWMLHNSALEISEGDKRNSLHRVSVTMPRSQRLGLGPRSLRVGAYGC